MQELEIKLMKKIVFVLLILFPLTSLSEQSLINDIPDFTQTNVKGASSGNGQQYCAPVAVSNSLVWLSNNQHRQLEFINTLASKSYMNTSLKNGTGTTGVLRGVDKLSVELFGGYKELVYEGWRKHPQHFSQGVKIPDIERLKTYITKKSAAWINVGWYRYRKQSNEYQRIGGHWVTLVGVEADHLIIHDPAPRAGRDFENEYVKYSVIENGTMTGNKAGLPVEAEGYISLGDGMHIRRKADFAIVDGVVYFKI